jgi:hypothetical protein
LPFDAAYTLGPLLKRDWQEDPSDVFPSSISFSKVRSCANVLTALSFAV